MPARLTHPCFRDAIEARAYQIQAAQQVFDGSCLVVMPTGLGKTAVQWMAMAETIHSKGRVLLVAPTTGLVQQQARMAREYLELSEESIITLTGEIAPAKRQPLFENALIIIATPQVIRNDVQAHRIDLGTIDLLIFDEAHHAVGNDAMAQVGDLYRNTLQGKTLACTASPGVKEEAILEVVERLGIDRMHVSRKEDALVAPHVVEMAMDECRIDLPSELSLLIKPIEELLEDESNRLKTGGFMGMAAKVSNRTIDEAQQRASAAIRRGDRRGYDAMRRISDLRRIHRLLDLLKTQSIGCARAYLERAEEEGRGKKRKTNRFLAFPEIHRFRNESKDLPELHPKPEQVKRLVKEARIEAPSGRVIVFTEYRDTVEILQSLLDGFDGLRSGRFIGQSGSGKRSGMRQREQLAQLQRFRDGEIDILIATSVAEEGLDVPSADHVILYEPVPSAIRAIQRRGRTARQRAGKVHVLIANGTRDEVVKHASSSREKRMYATLERMKRQRRLPAIANPERKSLERFRVHDQGEYSALEWLEKKISLIEDEKEIVEETKTKNPRSIFVGPERLRPRSQMGLDAFMDTAEEVELKPQEKWWGAVLDPNAKTNDEVAAAQAANAEVISHTIQTENNSPLIKIDHRESSSSLAAHLRANGVEFEAGTLPCGDVRISERVLIERKTSRDLVDSLLDGRLLHQCRRLSAAAASPLLIIESNDLTDSSRINSHAIEGALAWITLDLGLPVLVTKDTEQTARFIAVVTRREGGLLDRLTEHLSGSKSTNDSDAERRAITAASREVREAVDSRPLAARWKKQGFELRIEFLRGIPGIGTVLARRLLNHFGTLACFFDASREDLAEIEGLSAPDIERIWQIINE